jgi:hypothetical protein
VCQDERHPWSLPSSKAIPGIPCCLTLGTACSVHGVDLQLDRIDFSAICFGTLLHLGVAEINSLFKVSRVLGSLK